MRLIDTEQRILKMKRENLHFFFLNIGHFLDHLFVLIFANTPTETWQSGCLPLAFGLVPFRPPSTIQVWVIACMVAIASRVKTGIRWPSAAASFGNLDVAATPLLTGANLDLYDRKWAFIIPGVFSIATGTAYSIFLKAGDEESLYPTEGAANKGAAISIDRGVFIRVFAVIFLTTALGGIIF